MSLAFEWAPAPDVPQVALQARMRGKALHV
jgi:hypothetical protein